MIVRIFMVCCVLSIKSYNELVIIIIMYFIVCMWCKWIMCSNNFMWFTRVVRDMSLAGIRIVILIVR